MVSRSPGQALLQQVLGRKILTQGIARGTTEPLAPSFGVVVGDPLFEATKKMVPQLTGYKVDYPASFDPGSLNAGRDDVIKHMAEAPKRCPNQKYVMVGYSQGGDVMHNALAKIDPALFPRIIALVMFGDPGSFSCFRVFCMAHI